MAIPVTVRKDRGDVRANAQLAVLAEELRRHRKRRDLSIEQLGSELINFFALTMRS